MVSRDTKVHLGTVAATLAVLLGAEYAGLLPDGGPVLGVLVIVSYGAIFGGSHLAGGVTVGPVSLGTVALVVGGIAAAAYVVTESIDAYRSSANKRTSG